jgi:thymidylate synthase ThyX
VTTISAQVIADSVGRHAPRLTSILTRSPRWIHAEGRTHRRLRMGEELEFELRTPSPMEDPNLSRNAASSRAIPVPKMIEDVLNDPAVPLWWGANQPGMQAHAELTGKALEKARNEWFRALGSAVMHARKMHEIGAHKQIVNRIVEPYSHINVLWTGTQWTNFFGLRIHEDAEPHIRKLAIAMKAAMDASRPAELKEGDWHLPFVQPSDVEATQHHYRGAAKEAKQRFIDGDLVKLSVARCASLSYRTVDDRLMSRDDAYRLFEKLLDAQPIHASPAEHQAKVDVNDGDEAGGDLWRNAKLSGNLGPGWVQFRKTLENEEIRVWPT